MGIPRYRLSSHPERSHGARRRIFGLLMISSPLLFLAAVEILLRLTGFGPDLSLFTTMEIDGRTYHVMNPQVKARYFSSIRFDPATSPDLFQVPKPTGTFRIFCLGGSTTVGFPYWYTGAFSSFLRQRLTRTFPSRSIEVINIGMTATNSFAVLDIARDLVDYEPDLFVVYDGHNEFYGALGVASREGPARSRWLTLSYLRLIRFRTVLLLREVVGSVAGLFGPTAGDEVSGTLMERLASGRYVTYDGEMYKQGLSAFEENLADLRALCKAHSIPLIVSSQASNLRDAPPFNSGDSPGISPVDLTRLNGLINAALEQSMEGRPDSALAPLERAASLDSLRAETHFLIARCLSAVGDHHRAHGEYIRARDLDRLRFRASTDFNDAIRRTADDNSVFFADIESVLMGAAPDSLIGLDLLFEHVHPRAPAAFRIAKAYTQTMRAHKLLASPAEWSAADTLDEGALWDSRPLTPLDEDLARRKIEILTSGWPFQPHSRNPRPVRDGDFGGLLADSIALGRLTWEDGHASAAEHAEAAGDTVAAVKEYTAILSLYAEVLHGSPHGSGRASHSLSSARAEYLRLKHSFSHARER